MSIQSRRTFLMRSAAVESLCVLAALARAAKSPFRVAVITDEISPVFDQLRELTTETAGFYDTVGLNDDTRAFLSIPARHDAPRRIDCAFLGRLVAEHRIDEDEAHEVPHALTYKLVKEANKL